MALSTSGLVHQASSAISLGGWFALASLAYFAWKAIFTGLYDGLSGEKIAVLAVVAMVAAVILFLAGLLAGLAGDPGSGTGQPDGMKLAATAGFACGFIVDFAASLALAKLLSGAAAKLGDGYPAGFRMEAGINDISMLGLYALGGGIAGALAGYFYIKRG